MTRCPASGCRSAVLFLLLTFGLSMTAAAREEPPAPEPATGFYAKEPVVARHNMVVAAHPLAVEAGEWVLAQGGNAVDAAIAVQLVLNLVEPQSSGIGGGAFMLFYDEANNELLTYDGRETAPAAATPDMFLKPNGEPMGFFDAVVGGRSVGVPGLLRMLEMAHARHGELSWELLFRPAIELAEKDFPVSDRLHALLKRDKFLAKQEPARSYFYRPDGKPRERLSNPEFADVLRRIATDGADAFYRGEIAQDIVAAVRDHPSNPGRLAAADLAGYRALTRPPVCGAYRAFKICGAPPPTSGGIAVLQMLGILENFNIAAIPPLSLEAVHLVAEAGRLAYADRDHYVADPGFVEVPAAQLLAPAYLKGRAALISRDGSLGKAPPGAPTGIDLRRFGAGATLDLPSTTQISIVDSDGNALSMTSTIEHAFGSRVMVRGFLLNNEMTDFSFVPEKNGKLVANRIEPGKRPRSSMAPTIAFDRQGEVRIVVGSPGGAAIINYVVKTLIGVIDWQLDIQEAISLPNFGSQNGPTLLEKDTVLEALEEPLAALGHEVKITELNSGLHGITRVPFHWVGGADPRREGIARGAQAAPVQRAAPVQAE